MKKLLLTLAVLAATAATAQNLPEPGKYYRLVNGFSNGTDVRHNGCLGHLTVNDVDLLGTATVDADAANQKWQFVAKEIDGITYYAIVNMAGEYIPQLATSFSSVQGTVHQDSQFAAQNITDDLPDDAYAFTLGNGGVITADLLAHYDATVTGMSEGDSYFTIKPKQYKESRTATEGTANSIYYLNLAGGGRNNALHLWSLEGNAPQTSQYFILVPIAAAPAPEFPKENTWYQLNNQYNADQGERYGRLMIYQPGQNNDNLMSEKITEIATEQQLWRFEWNGYAEAYAMICKSNEAGYVKYNTVNSGMDAEWRYSATTPAVALDKFGFVVATNGDYYTITSTTTTGGNVMNLAAAGKNYRINCFPSTGGVGNHQNAVMWTIDEYKPAAPSATHDDSEVGETVNIHGKDNPTIVITALDNHQLWYKWTAANTPAVAAEDATDADGFTLHDSTSYTHAIDNVGTLQYYSVLHGVKSDVKTINVISDSGTSISEISAKAADGAIYDLQGRRLAAPVKGVNIIGGRKVLIK